MDELTIKAIQDQARKTPKIKLLQRAVDDAIAETDRLGMLQVTATQELEGAMIALSDALCEAVRAARAKPASSFVAADPFDDDVQPIAE